ncbi:MAG: glycosyltransferase [Limisphaerales bacterium]
MKTAQVLYKATRQMAGVAQAARCLSLALCRSPNDAIIVDVLALQDAFDEEDCPLWKPLVPRTLPVAWGRSPELTAALIGCQPDVIHCHGLWGYHVRACSISAAQTRRPYVVSPQGMLTDWELRHSFWKKKLALWTYQGMHLRRAACLHAVSESEYLHFRKMGLRNPVCQIPNGVDLPAADGDQGKLAPPWSGKVDSGKKVLLFLGRINRKKGVGFLIDAWGAAVRRKAPGTRDWTLVVAGWSQFGHQDEFEEQVNAAGLTRSILFSGPFFGQAKLGALRNADAFVLPSQDEGLPSAVLEAWMHRRPVLMTRQCNLPEGFEAGGAIAAEPSAESLCTALESLLAMSDEQRQEMGAKGYRLAKEKFSSRVVAEKMKAVYEWLLGGGPPPSWVRVD